MGEYRVSVKDHHGNQVPDFRACIAHSGTCVATAVLNGAGPATILADGQAFPGSGNLYIVGPGDPANAPNRINFSHFEVIDMAGTGEFTFVLANCPKADHRPDPEPKQAPAATDYDLPSAVLAELQPTRASVVVPAARIMLDCTHVSLEVHADAPHSHVFKLRLQGLTWLTREILVAPGGTHRVRLNSSHGAWRCDIYRADANGAPEAVTLHTVAITLREAGRPVAAHVLVTPEGVVCPPPVTFPRYKTATIAPPAGLPPYRHKRGDLATGADNRKIHDECFRHAKDWVLAQDPQARRIGILCFVSDDHGGGNRFVLAEGSGDNNWNIRPYRDSEIPGMPLWRDMTIHRLEVEWVVDA